MSLFSLLPPLHPAIKHLVNTVLLGMFLFPVINFLVLRPLASQIAGRKEAEKRLLESEAGLATAQRIARMGSWHWDVENNEQYWSDEIYRIFGLAPQEFKASYAEFIRFIKPEDRELVMKAVNEALDHRKPYSLAHRVIRRNGEERIVHEEGEVTFDPQGRPLRMVGTVQDITERKMAEAEMKMLSTAIERSTNIIFITDRTGSIEYVNRMFTKVTGYSREDLLGQSPDILNPEDMPGENTNIWGSILVEEGWKGTLKSRKKNGDVYWVSGMALPMRDEKGEVTHFLIVHEDITEKVATEEKVQYLTHHDELTGLLNRACFLERLEDVLKTNSAGVLLLLDVDSLKFINDRYGQYTGDEILRAMGRIITDYGRHESPAEQFIISRLGDDEFAMYLESKTEEQGKHIAEALRKKIEAYPFSPNDVRLTASIGVAFCPAHGTTTKDLMAKASAALYRAKHTGQNKCYIYSPEDRALKSMQLKLKSKERIIKALEEDRFEPWYQPILDLNGTDSHYEALARLRGDDDNIILPDDFMDAAESYGLIGYIDRVMLTKTINLQAMMRGRGESVHFSMNLSGKNFGDEDLLSFLKSLILESGADPANLIFEITETAAIQDLERAIAFIRALKSIGCRFSLDDFGAGFTSFVYLKELDVDFIKIDGSFIKRLHKHPKDQLVVRAITGIAKGLGIKTIAEFVETEKTLELLKAYGVDYAQGYLIGKPSPSHWG